MLTVRYEVVCDACGKGVSSDATQLSPYMFALGVSLPKPNLYPVCGMDLCDECSTIVREIVNKALSKIRDGKNAV